MKYLFIKDLISDNISGEWGIDPVSDKRVKVIRTTNFTNEGKVNLSNVVEREISDAKVQQKQLKFGDVIIEKSGGSPSQPVGRVVFFDVNDEDTYLCNNFTAILRPSEKVFPKYLFYVLYYLHLQNRTLNYQNKTTGIINLQLDRYLKSEQITLPPIEDQKKIVKVLDRADALRQKRNQAIELLDDYLQSVFWEMFGDPVRNPKEWKRIPLSEILLKIESGHSPVCLDRAAMPGEWGVLKLGAVTKCIYDPAENKALPDIEKPNPHIEIRAGDILFSRKNTYELVAACAYVWETPPKLMMSDLIFRLVPRDKDSINAIFLQALLSFSSKRKMIQKLAGGAAGSMPNISKAKLLEHRIEVPPYFLQNEFAEIVKKTESLKHKMFAQSEELENQFQALMQKAFKGTL